MKPLTPTQQRALAILADGKEHILKPCTTGHALVQRGLATRRNAPSANVNGYVTWFRISPDADMPTVDDFARFLDNSLPGEPYP